MPQKNRDALKVTSSCTVAAVLLGEHAEWCKGCGMCHGACAWKAAIPSLVAQAEESGRLNVIL